CRSWIMTTLRRGSSGRRAVAGRSSRRSRPSFTSRPRGAREGKNSSPTRARSSPRSTRVSSYGRPTSSRADHDSRPVAFTWAHREGIGRALARGDLEAGGRRFTSAPAQAARLRLLRADPIPWDQLWPALKLLSCWTDGSSGLFVDSLSRRFPGVLLQGKGLLATEAPITIPLIYAPAPVPL